MKRPARKRSSQRGEDSDWGKGRTGWCAGGLGLCACFESRPGDGREQVSGEQSNARPPQKVHVYVIVFFLWPLLVSFQPPAEEQKRREFALHHSAAGLEAIQRTPSTTRWVEQGLGCSLQPSTLGIPRFSRHGQRENWFGSSRRALALPFCFLRGDSADDQPNHGHGNGHGLRPLIFPAQPLLTMQARGMQLLWTRNGHLPALLQLASA